MSPLVDVLVGALVGALVAAFVMRARSRRTLTTSRRQLDRATEQLADQARDAADHRDVREAILDAMEEGVLLLAADGSPLFSNNSLATHLGTVPHSAEAIRPLDLQACVLRAMATGEVERAEVEIGSPARWLRATTLPTGSDGTVLLVVRDITQARQLLATRRDFVANASHELKTPVASIRAAAETLRLGAINDPPAAMRFTEQLERESIRLSRIIADLLDLSRLESGSELGDDVHLNAVAADEVERLEDMALEHEVALLLQTEPVPRVRGSARDLALLVRNLIDNAIRYTPSGGEVAVTVGSEGRRVLLRVADTGVGIPQRDLPRIFERFYRVDQARSRETGGTGLGLAIVRHVCENHGGEVTVTSELGSGTTFEVRLPALDAIPGAPA